MGDLFESKNSVNDSEGRGRQQLHQPRIGNDYVVLQGGNSSVVGGRGNDILFVREGSEAANDFEWRMQA